jgi:hypothetical protein
LVISFGRSRSEDVVSLIAARKYGRAIELLKAQLQKRGTNPRLRMQLADVLLLADKKPEAVALLLPLADQYARDGFAAKAVSVLKKIQKVDPGRRDVEERLARQIEERQREAVVLPRSFAPARADEPAAPEAEFPGGPVIEIGFEMAPISAPVAPAPAPGPARAPLPPRAAPPEPPSPDATLPVGSPLLAGPGPELAPFAPPAPASPVPSAPAPPPADVS